MARTSAFERAMQGFEFGSKAAQSFLDARLESEAARSYKNSDQTSGSESSFGKVQADGLYTGPGRAMETPDEWKNRAVEAMGEADFMTLPGRQYQPMSNAEAASYGLLQPETTKTRYTLGGVSQDAAFTPNQIEANRTKATADVYANAGRFKEAQALRQSAARLGLDEAQMQPGGGHHGSDQAQRWGGQAGAGRRPEPAGSGGFSASGCWGGGGGGGSGWGEYQLFAFVQMRVAP